MAAAAALGHCVRAGQNALMDADNIGEAMDPLTIITERIDREMTAFAEEFNRPPLSAIPSPYREALLSYVLRKAKRMRPALFIFGYSGYSSSDPRHLYRSAIALEFLHEFVLIHDDIIDHSLLRRGAPALHTRFAQELARTPGARVSAEDLAMVAGDVMYAVGINAFLAVDAPPDRKLRALE